MPFQLILTIEYVTDAEWRWVLADASGRFLADQEVKLDTDDPLYEGFKDLPHHLGRYANVRPAEEVLGELGEWMGAKVFGAVGDKLLEYEQSPACVVRVRVPPEAQNLLFRPFELAHLGGRPLAARGFRFVYTVAREGEQRPGGAAPRDDGATEALRVLGIFSLPRDATPLNLRRERYRLQRLVRDFVQRRGRSVELRLLQYGATREILTGALQEAPGWDVMHFSGHGAEGELVLEKLDGAADRIDAEELAGLLRPAGARLKLLTLSACYSGAADLRAARAQVGLDNPPSRVAAPTEATTVLPSLGQRLAEELDCAVLAMRYPVLDDFATELALTLYDRLLEKRQPLPQALQLALADALAPARAPFRPEFSRLTPLLFGARAAELTLQAPQRTRLLDAPESGLFHFPLMPARFVGRLMPMLRASQALAPESGKTGAFFYGIAGAGKTACALELAYRYDPKNLERFTYFVWHKAPEEGRDIADSLTRFALSMEDQLPGLKLVGIIDNPEDFRRKALPRLRGLLRENSILLVLDNLEGLLTSRDEWRDPRWGELLEVLLDHDGLSRLVLTSRRLPASLAGHPRLQADAIHALSFQESVLLARELPNLKPLFKDANGRNKVRRILAAAQGHPKLLELADGLASDPDALEAQLARDEATTGHADAARTAFFETGHSNRPEDLFVRELRTWTEGVADSLPPTARLLAQFLARLEDADRTSTVVEGNWEDFLKRLTGERGDNQQPAPEPVLSQAQAALREAGLGLETAVNQLAKVGLIEIETQTVQAQQSSATYQRFRLHPGVADALLRFTPPDILSAADKELSNYFMAMFYHGIKTEMQGGGWLVVEGARHAATYLLREQRWHDAASLLERMLQRDTSPDTLALAIPLLHLTAEKTRGTEFELACASVLAKSLRVARRHAEAEVALREIISRSVEQGKYDVASSGATELFNLLLITGRFEEALQTAKETAGYTGRAGLGPWTQLTDEIQHMQALNALGRYTEVLAAVEQHRGRMEHLPEKSEVTETVNPWKVRELLLDTGRSAALNLSRWDTALALNADILAYMRKRGADEVDVARTRFNDYGPLLRLGRYGEARTLLDYCRVTFEHENAFYELGKTYSAIADLEDDQGNHTAAVRFEQTALRYEYLAAAPDSCAISHNNLAGYIMRVEGSATDAVLAHLLVGGVIRFQVSSGTMSQSVRNLALTPRPPEPPAFDQVCDIVEQAEGVRFRELFAYLPKRAANGDEAIRTIWDMATAASEGLKEEEERRAHEYLNVFEPLLQGIAAALDDEEARGEIEEILPQLEEGGWHISDAVRRIWAGEREVGVLTEGLDERHAALVRRVLELLEAPSE
ncbi:MAG TPA: CHAT domain-containing protein [Pyrinomonadaceae bacterium]